MSKPSPVHQSLISGSNHLEGTASVVLQHLFQGEVFSSHHGCSFLARAGSCKQCRRRQVLLILHAAGPPSCPFEHTALLPDLLKTSHPNILSPIDFRFLSQTCFVLPITSPFTSLQLILLSNSSSTNPQITTLSPRTRYRP